MKHTDFQLPTQCGFHYDPVRRQVRAYQPDAVYVLRLDPPQAWLRDARHPGWLHVRRVPWTAFARLLAMADAWDKRVAWTGLFGKEVHPGKGVEQALQLRADLDPVALQQARRFGGDVWPMYAFFVRCPAARELAETQPLLAYGLAFYVQATGHKVAWPLRTVRRLLKRKRREIAGALGLPASEMAVRIAGRVPASEVSVPILERLRSAMAMPSALRKLRHLHRIDETTLELLADPATEPYVHLHLLEDAARAGAMPRDVDNYGFLQNTAVARWLRDTANLLHAEGRRLPMLRSITQVRELHDEAAATARSLATENLAFGPPALPGQHGIEPLTSAVELHEEAEEMHNCLAGSWFVYQVLTGQLWVYRVTQPERASLSIRRTAPGAPWVIDDLKAPCNKSVQPETSKEVQRWLADTQRRVLALGEQLSLPFHEDDFEGPLLRAWRARAEVEAIPF
ncbi:MAG: hypothetical protein ACOYOB_04590 [Myxococcota bacterium]